MCPGKKEFVKINDKKEHKQKRLLLLNLKELHIELLQFGQSIRFPKFCQLRPKWYITVDSSSAVHSVCVCETHQNCKLIEANAPDND